MKINVQNLHSNVYHNFAHNIQNPTQIPINRQIDTPNIVHLYNEILFSYKKEQIDDTCNNMDECPKHDSEPKKPDTL